MEDHFVNTSSYGSHQLPVFCFLYNRQANALWLNNRTTAGKPKIRSKKRPCLHVDYSTISIIHKSAAATRWQPLQIPWRACDGPLTWWWHVHHFLAIGNFPFLEKQGIQWFERFPQTVYFLFTHPWLLLRSRSGQSQEKIEGLWTD